MSEAHPELGFWRKYVFSTDHKMIGIQYGLTALVFLFFGFCLMMLMRWHATCCLIKTTEQFCL